MIAATGPLHGMGTGVPKGSRRDHRPRVARGRSTAAHSSSAIRRLGMGVVQRIGPLKDQFMAEARGESGDLPLLLRGLQI